MTKNEKTITVSHKSSVIWALSAYLGMKCEYCGFKFTDIDEMNERKVVWVGSHTKSAIACKKCFDENHGGE